MTHDLAQIEATLREERAVQRDAERAAFAQQIDAKLKVRGCWLLAAD